MMFSIHIEFSSHIPNHILTKYRVSCFSDSHLFSIHCSPSSLGPGLLSSWYDHVDVFRAVPVIAACQQNRTPQRLMEMDEFQERWQGSATRQLVGNKNATKAARGAMNRRSEIGWFFLWLSYVCFGMVWLVKKDMNKHDGAHTLNISCACSRANGSE